MNLDNYIATPGRDTRDALRSQLYEMERRADSAEAALYKAREEREALLAALREIAGMALFVGYAPLWAKVAREAIAAAEGGKG